MSGTELNISVKATDTATATFKRLQRAVDELNVSIVQMQQMAAGKSEQVVASLNREIESRRQQIASIREQQSALQIVGEVAKASAETATVAVNQTTQALLRAKDAAVALDDAMVKSFNRAPAASMAAMDAQIAYFNKKREEIIQPIGEEYHRRNMVEQLSGSQFFDLQNKRMGIGRQPLSASESAEAFSHELGPSGLGITSVETKATIDSLHQVNRELLSAKDSAMAFSQALGPAGLGVTSVSTKAVIDSLHGINEQLLSAEASAAVFVRELEAIGTAVRLTPAAGFHRMVSDLADVKQSLLSAADSAKVFEREGLTAYERSIGMTEQTVAAAAKAESRRGGPSVHGQDVATSRMLLGMRHAQAAIDSLASGHRGQFFSSLGAAAKDAGLGVAGLATSMGTLVTVMAGAALLRGAEHMGEWATNTSKAAQAAGMGISEYSALQGALGLAGVKADSADAAMRRFAQNLAQATRDPASEAAAGFHALGISQQELIAIGGNVEKGLKRVADAYQQTNESANKTEALTKAVGRNFEDLIPALEKGSAGLEGLMQKAKELGITLTEEDVKSLRETGEAVKELGDVIQSGAIKAFVAWGPEIKSIVALLEGLFKTIGAVTSAIGYMVSIIPKAEAQLQKLGTMGDLIHITTNPIGAISDGTMSRLMSPSKGKQVEGVTGTYGPNQPKTDVPELEKAQTITERARAAMSAAGLAAAQQGGNSHQMRVRELNAEADALKKFMSENKLNTQQQAELQNELMQKQISAANAGAAGSGKAANSAYKDFAAAEKEKIAAAHGSSAEIAAIYDEWVKAANEKYKQHVSVVKTLEAEKINAVRVAKLEELREETKQYEDTQKLSLVNARLQGLQQGTGPVKGENVGPTVDLNRAKDYIQQAQQLDAAYSQQVEKMKDLGASTSELMGIETKYKTEEVELYQKAADATQAAVNKILEPITHMFDSIGSGFENLTGSILKSLLDPQVDRIHRGLTTTTYKETGNEIRTAFRGAFVSLAGDFAKSMEGAITKTLANALSGGASNTLSNLLSNSLGKLVGQVFPSLAGSFGSGAVGGATTSAAIAASAATITTGVSAALATSTAATIGAITGSTAAIVGAITGAAASEDALLVSNAVKPSAAGFSYSLGGIVPSAAGGMVVGGTGGSLSILHAQEMVLPAHLSKGIQGIINNGSRGGNQANLNYSPTINTGPRGRGGTGLTRAEFSQMMSLHGGAMLGEARNMMRSGWRPA